MRLGKGAVTVLVATAACHTLMSAGFASARDSASGSDDAFAGTFEFLLTMAASWALMPLLLWAGMRVMGETGNVAMVIVGGLAWLGLSGYCIDDIDRAGGHIPAAALAAYILLGTGLAGSGPDRRG
ncbi:hypothetical protein N4P33_14505 [Streptomyces sp. 15-116A]|nr:hypothetical protein [Streptomyces sp. 15-116A]MCT7353378.1 hypothetical protein [Streptomyces sp. 15-116A]